MSRILTPSRLAGVALLALGSFLAACGVSTEQHNAVLDGLATSEQALLDCQSHTVSMENEIASLERSNRACRAQADGLLGHLAASNDQADRRDAIYEHLVGRLQASIDAGHLQVRVEDGRIVLILPNDVLFESGRAELGASGQATLTDVASALASLDDQRFQIEGHTDDVPISNARFASNWDLSTARAVSVVNLLVEHGVAPQNLSAAGFGEFAPASSNATDADRAQNRRIKIVLVPDLGNLPEVQASTH